MKLIQRPALFAIALLAFLSLSSKANNQIPVRVVVITAFQGGDDDDPTKGEFGNWVLNLPLPETIPLTASN
jgi:hypothetical protein